MSIDGGIIDLNGRKCRDYQSIIKKLRDLVGTGKSIWGIRVLGEGDKMYLDVKITPDPSRYALVRIRLMDNFFIAFAIGVDGLQNPPEKIWYQMKDKPQVTEGSSSGSSGSSSITLPDEYDWTVEELTFSGSYLGLCGTDDGPKGARIGLEKLKGGIQSLFKYKQSKTDADAKAGCLQVVVAICEGMRFTALSKLIAKEWTSSDGYKLEDEDGTLIHQWGTVGKAVEKYGGFAENIGRNVEDEEGINLLNTFISHYGVSRASDVLALIKRGTPKVESEGEGKDKVKSKDKGKGKVKA